MLTHDQIWSAIDALAAKYGMSSSGLSRSAGLDPTTFNKSKRLTPDGRQRWPSTESIAKILKVTGASLDDFVALVADSRGGERRMRLIRSSEAARPGSFGPAGEPAGGDWDDLVLAGVGEAAGFALEVEADVASPLYREGSIVIALPGAPTRRGDRILARRKSGALLIGEIRRETADSIELVHCGPADETVTCPRAELAFTARIHWVSQ